MSLKGPQSVRHASIIGTGSYLPERVVPNSELEPLLHTTDTWIREKIGIKERRYAAKNQGASDLALPATQAALTRAGLLPTDLDAIIFATSTSEYQAPGSGVLLQNKLGCCQIPAFDIRNTSPGFLFSLELASGLLSTQRYKNILVVAAECHSRVLDFSEKGRMMSVIFGDGAGAVILQATQENTGLIDFVLHSDGLHAQKLWYPGVHSLQAAAEPVSDYLFPQMDGRFVFENAVSDMSNAAEQLLTRNNLKLTDIDLVLSHQANLRIIKAIQKRLQLSDEKVPHNIERVGNTSSASIPILYDELVQSGRIKPGLTLLAMSFGSGFSWGAALIKT